MTCYYFSQIIMGPLTPTQIPTGYRFSQKTGFLVCCWLLPCKKCNFSYSSLSESTLVARNPSTVWNKILSIILVPHNSPQLYTGSSISNGPWKNPRSLALKYIITICAFRQNKIFKRGTYSFHDTSISYWLNFY